MGGACSQVETYFARPTSAPHVSKQLTTQFHTQPLFTTLVYRSGIGICSPTLIWPTPICLLYRPKSGISPKLRTLAPVTMVIATKYSIVYLLVYFYLK